MNWSLSDFDSLGDIEEVNKWILEIKKLKDREDKEIKKAIKQK